MKNNSFTEQLRMSSNQSPSNDQESTNATQTSLEDVDNNSPIQRRLCSHLSQKYELPSDVGQLETNIHKWLDEQGVLMANPAEKEDKYYEKKRNSIWAHFRNSISSNNLSISRIESSPEEQIASPIIRSPELRQLPKLNSNNDLCGEQDIQQLFTRKQSDSLFERRKGRMNTMNVQGSQNPKPSIYSQCRAQVHES